jgi:hypothetical protein
MNEPVKYPPQPFVVAVAGWALPGLGYWLIGHRWRAIASGAAIILLFVSGLLIGGIRVIDVPGVDPVEARRGGVTLAAAIMEKPWYIPQFLNGPINFAASLASKSAVENKVPRSTARVFEIGQLYTAVAGMLNLFIIIDAAYRAARIRDENPQLESM